MPQNIITESEKLKAALTPIVREIMRSDPEYTSCLRVQKAKVISPPDGSTCTVRIIGETTDLELPYSSRIPTSIQVGAMVWVLIISNSLSSAIVWERINFRPS